jgi:hypothetical protein
MSINYVVVGTVSAWMNILDVDSPLKKCLWLALGTAGGAYLWSIHSHTCGAIAVGAAAMIFGWRVGHMFGVVAACAVLWAIGIGWTYTALPDWRITQFYDRSGSPGYHRARLEAVLADVSWMPSDRGASVQRLPHGIEDCTFAVDCASSGGLLTCLAYASVILLITKYLLLHGSGYIAMDGSKYLCACVLITGCLHVLSSLGLIPTLGVPFPVMTPSNSLGVVLGLFVGLSLGTLRAPSSGRNASRT